VVDAPRGVRDGTGRHGGAASTASSTTPAAQGLQLPLAPCRVSSTTEPAPSEVAGTTR